MPTEFDVQTKASRVVDICDHLWPQDAQPLVEDALREAYAAGQADVKSSVCQVLEGFERNVFTRNCDRDHEPGWALVLIPYLTALGHLANVFTSGTPDPDGKNSAS